MSADWGYLKWRRCEVRTDTVMTGTRQGDRAGSIFKDATWQISP
jgi:hypothetical protein